jgi:transcriptional regulator with XRE-family HTH domain
MVCVERLRAFRELKNLSQGDIERRTGLLRCYISRIENGHAIPGIETLEKIARGMDVPLYQLFYDGEEPPKLPTAPGRKTKEDGLWGSSGKDARTLARFRKLLMRTDEKGRMLLLFLAQQMVRLSDSQVKSQPVERL